MNQHRILGPVMIPDKEILRYHDDIGYYILVFSAEVIRYYREKFHIDRKETNINIEHSREIDKSVLMTDSFLIDTENRRLLPNEFQDLPEGTWMIEMILKDKEEAEKHGNLTGFSVEGTFRIVGQNGETHIVTELFHLLSKKNPLLPFDVHVYGGTTGGSGRNEHGEAHFTLKEKNSGKDLGKLYMPSLDVWQKSSRKEKIELMKVHGTSDISRSDKKAMVDWLNVNDNENLIRGHMEWNDRNKNNNRVIFIN